MIRLIEVLNYRCLRCVRQPLDSFHIMVGPNGSGKSAFMDAIAFLSDFVRSGLEAVDRRSPNCRDLFWNGEGDRFEIAIEAAIPDEQKKRLRNNKYESARYEISVGLTEDIGELAILGETLWLKPVHENVVRQVDLFPESIAPPSTILSSAGRSPGWKKIIGKVAGSGNDYYTAETSTWNNLFRLGPKRSALANLPADEERFPVSTWLKEVLLQNVQRLEINPAQLRSPSPPGRPSSLREDGSGLAWMIKDLAQKHRKAFASWIAHLRTVLPNLRAVRTIERPEDRHRYLMLQYATGASFPSWVVSEGTLRMLALTVLAYIPGLNGVLLIEEPENGIHPTAVNAVLDSLACVYDAQVLLASHSPVILGLARAEDVLCFAKTDTGATDIVRGSEHPKLREWRGQPTFDVLFASGILG